MCLRLTLQRHKSPVWRLKPSVYQSPSGGQQHTGVPHNSVRKCWCQGCYEEYSIDDNVEK